MQLRQWHTRLSLLLLYMVGATAVISSVRGASSMQPGAPLDDTGMQLEALLLNRVLNFCHAPFLGTILCFSPEVTAPLARGFRRAIATLPWARTPARRFPRSVSGIW